VSERSVLLLFLGDPPGDRRAQNFARYFESEGWHVELIAIQPSAAKGPRRFLEYHRRLKHAMKSKRVDVVFACDLYSLSAARSMKRNGQAKVLIYDSREIYTELPAVARRPIVKLVWRNLERRGLSDTDILIVTAPLDAQVICDIHGFLPRSVLVRNLPWLEADIVRDRSLLDRFGIPREARVGVYVGGLQQGRGLEKLIDSFIAFKSENKHLLLIGSGALRMQLEQQVKQNDLTKIVHFAGWMPADDALRMTAACDLGITLVEPVSRSYELALPSKLFEYMMAGIPVVSSRVEQVSDLFDNEEWITFVDVENPQSIRDGLAKAFANSENQSLRTRERDLAMSEFHFEHDALVLTRAMKNFIIHQS
jgi:glycosyltransferase involved in cell wall biosynthesis